MDDIIRPKNMVAKAQAEQKASAQATEQKQQEELMMKAYADYLDELKEKSPDEYKKVVDDMMAAAKGGKLDGLKTPAGLIGKDGKSGSRFAARWASSSRSWRRSLRSSPSQVGKSPQNQDSW